MSRLAPRVQEQVDEAYRQRHGRQEEEERPCLRQSCASCKGSGRKGDGRACVHLISCPCPRCRVTM